MHPIRCHAAARARAKRFQSLGRVLDGYGRSYSGQRTFLRRKLIGHASEADLAAAVPGSSQTAPGSWHLHAPEWHPAPTLSIR